MKILQVNCVYRKGSTGKIVYDIHTELLQQGISSVVCYGRGKAIKEKNVYKFCTETEANFSHLFANLGGLQYASAPFATWKLERIITREKPDVVHLHCINGFCVNIYQLLRFLAKNKIKTVVTHHAEFFYTGNCGHSLYCNKWMTNEGCNSCHDLRAATGSRTIDNTHRSWKQMRKAFASFDEDKLHFTAVSPWVVGRSMMSNVLKRYPCTCVMNGVDTSVFHNVKDAMDTLQNKLPIGYKDFVLHVTAFFTTDEKSLKGGRYIVQLARMMPKQQFIVVASEVLETDNLPSNILLWGRANGQNELAALYSAAKATVIVSERETFSMVTAESLCCGTPVVGFKAGGPESIALTDYAKFVEYEKVELLYQSLQNVLAKEWNNKVIADESKNRYARKVMTEGYINVYKQLINDEK